jgi:hypothetical protein
MIPTNPNFGAKNEDLVKRPLYIVTIDGIFEPLTTFRIEEADIVWSGYGVAGYGTTGYGF